MASEQKKKSRVFFIVDQLRRKGMFERFQSPHARSIVVRSASLKYCSPGRRIS